MDRTWPLGARERVRGRPTKLRRRWIAVLLAAALAAAGCADSSDAQAAANAAADAAEAAQAAASAADAAQAAASAAGAAAEAGQSAADSAQAAVVALTAADEDDRERPTLSAGADADLVSLCDDLVGLPLHPLDGFSDDFWGDVYAAEVLASRATWLHFCAASMPQEAGWICELTQLDIQSRADGHHEQVIAALADRTHGQYCNE